jgi:hypothetical protein
MSKTQQFIAMLFYQLNSVERLQRHGQISWVQEVEIPTLSFSSNSHLYSLTFWRIL